MAKQKPLVGSIRSASGKIALYLTPEEVPEDLQGGETWALFSDSAKTKGLRARAVAAGTLGLEDPDELKVFSEGQEGNFWVVSCGYEAPPA